MSDSASASPPPVIAPAPPAIAPVTTDRTPATARNIVLLWCLWLLGSWTVTMRIDAAVPASRWMMYACITGLMIIWPLLRLSQDLPRRSAALIVLWDWLCLNLVFQAVIWPLQFSAGWSWWQAVWIDASIAAWSALTGFILAMGAGWRGGLQRAIAMALCLAVVLGEPLVMALLNSAMDGDRSVTWSLRISPVTAIRDMTAAEPSTPVAAILSVAVAAALGWVAVSLTQRSK